MLTKEQEQKELFFVLFASPRRISFSSYYFASPTTPTPRSPLILERIQAVAAAAGAATPYVGEVIQEALADASMTTLRISVAEDPPPPPLTYIDTRCILDCLDKVLDSILSRSSSVTRSKMRPC
jgi:hypothetical protein